MSSPIRRFEDDDSPVRFLPPRILDRRLAVEPKKRLDVAGQAFIGDRAMLELQRQLALAPDRIPEPPLRPRETTQNPWLMVSRFGLVAGVAALVAWGILWLPDFRKAGPEITQADGPQPPTEVKRVKVVELRPPSERALANQDQLAAANQPPPVVGAAVPLSETPAVASAGRTAPASAMPQAASSKPAVTPAVPMTEAMASPALPASTPPARLAASAATGPALMPAAAATAPVSVATAGAAIAPAMAASTPAAASLQRGTVSKRASASVQPGTASTPASAATNNGPQVDSGEIAMLVTRGKDFLASGDLTSAQLLFRRAADAGSAEAAFALASTYDPHYLAEHNVVGIVGDEVKARAWYQRAMDLGSSEAGRMLAQFGNK